MWRDLIRIAAPAAAALSSQGPRRTGVLQGYLAEQDRLAAEREQHQQHEQSRSQNGAQFLMNVSNHLSEVTDPVEFERVRTLYRQVAPAMGAPVDGLDTVPFNHTRESQAKATRIREALDQIQKTTGIDPNDEAHAGHSLRLQDGTELPWSDAIRIAYPTEMANGAPVAAPKATPKIEGATEDERLLSAWAREHGKKLNDLTFSERQQAKREAADIQNRPGGQIESGNIDLSNRAPVKNADGTVSTVRSIGVNIDGQEVLIPTVVNGKVVSNDEAIAEYQRTGQHLGKFKDAASATAFAQKLHDQEAERISKGQLANLNELRIIGQQKRNAAPVAGDEPINADDVTNAAESILSGRMAPSQLSLVGGMGNRGVKFKQAVVAEVNKRNPDFSWQAAESGYQFGKNTGTQNTVRFSKSVQNSMPSLLASAQALNNGNVRGINALVNAGRHQVGNVNLTDFQTKVLFVSDEIAKILQGGGTGSGTSDAKLKQAQSILSTSDSPAQIEAALKAANELIGFRVDEMTRGTFMENKNQPPAPPPPATGGPSYQDYLRSRGRGGQP